MQGLFCYFKATIGYRKALSLSFSLSYKCSDEWCPTQWIVKLGSFEKMDETV